MDLNLQRFRHIDSSRFRALTTRTNPAIHLTAVTCLVLLAWMGCAAKRDYSPASVPGWDVVQSMPLEPPDELSTGQQEDFRNGWRNVQQGNLELAASEFESLSRRYARSPEIATARGFLELRLGGVVDAERWFQTALRERPSYGLAQGGYFLVALTQENDELAYDRLARLEQDYPQHPLVDRYRTTLQINVAESRLADARELARAGSYDEAASAYLRALEVAPEVGALYLEAAQAELAAGLTERAVQHATKATELEPDNADAHRVLGEAHYAGENLTGAYEAYRAAVDVRPNDDEILERFATIEREYEEKNLPTEYLAIADAERVTRAQIAALFYFGLRSAVESATAGERVIASDIRSSWASAPIHRVVSVGIMEVYPNHMFHPEYFVTRVELSEALSKALEQLAPDAYRAASDSLGATQGFSDLPSSNPSYTSAALAVSLGLLDVGDDGEFEPRAFVSGAAAISAVEALEAHVMP